ncbi:MAG: malonyl-ACP O-methyltransferase BioC [Thiobacillaceae bacterium]|nr:malonyl-ACP O-methyltransferase BioC [Thiobacillaceae bacterium]
MHARRAIRAAFERAAAGYDAAAVLQQEVARRLDERLTVMRIDPAVVLDAGCGTGFGLPLLRARYPRARLLALDLALAMLRQARAKYETPPGPLGRLWSRLTPHASPLSFLCADLERLPLAASSLDLVWSNLTLQWVGDPVQTFRELRRVLRPGGLLLFSTFGPDTLKELRQAFAGVDGHAHVNRFIDLHDLGDALVHTGFQHPVMEMEFITLTYPDLKALLRELKAIGADTVLEGRRRGLMGKASWQRLEQNYERLRRADGRLPATFEVIYGHAWAVGPGPAQGGRRVISLRLEPG